MKLNFEQNQLEKYINQLLRIENVENLPCITIHGGIEAFLNFFENSKKEQILIKYNTVEHALDELFVNVDYNEGYSKWVLNFVINRLDQENADCKYDECIRSLSKVLNRINSLKNDEDIHVVNDFKLYVLIDGIAYTSEHTISEYLNYKNEILQFSLDYPK